MAYFVEKIEQGTKGSTKTRGRATAVVLPGAPRPAAGCFSRQRRRGLVALWGCIGGGWRSAEPERSRYLVGARVVREAERDEKLGLQWPCNF